MSKTFNLTLTSIFIALIAIFSFTPIGYMGVPGTIEFTTVHLVVIVGSCLFSYMIYKEKQKIFFPIHGLIFGTAWGVFSLMMAWFTAGPGAIPFRNPLVSVLPRMLVGIVCGFGYLLFNKKINRRIVQILVATLLACGAVYAIANSDFTSLAFLIVGGTMIVISFIIMNKFAKRKKDEAKREIYLNIATTAAFTTLTNTVLVLLALNIYFGMVETDAAIKEMFLTIISINVIVEQLIAIIIVPPVTMSLINMHKKVFKG